MQASLNICQRIVVIAVLFSIGCGGGASTKPGSAEPQKVATVVSGLNDAASDEVAFQSLFVSGNAPQERGKYFSSAIEIVGIPTVNGNDATVDVKISQGGSQGEGSGALKNEEIGSGQVTWTLKKEGTDWKIADAPLP